MAKRIGKYRMTKKEVALSAVDGGTVSGNLTGITNLTTTGTNSFSGATNITAATSYIEKISLLSDLTEAGAIRSALTIKDTGTHFIVPALTTGTQTITLPASTAANVGFTCKFTMLATAAQIFSVDTAAAGDKIMTAEPDGDGDFTINAAADKFRFTANAVLGASFRITCVSATDAVAFTVSEIVSGLAAGTGEHVAA